MSGRLLSSSVGSICSPGCWTVGRYPASELFSSLNVALSLALSLALVKKLWRGRATGRPFRCLWYSHGGYPSIGRSSEGPMAGRDDLTAPWNTMPTAPCSDSTPSKVIFVSEVMGFHSFSGFGIFFWHLGIFGILGILAS